MHVGGNAFWLIQPSVIVDPGSLPRTEAEICSPWRGEMDFVCTFQFRNESLAQFRKRFVIDIQGIQEPVLGFVKAQTQSLRLLQIRVQEGHQMG